MKLLGLSILSSVYVLNQEYIWLAFLRNFGNLLLSGYRKYQRIPSDQTLTFHLWSPIIEFDYEKALTF